MGGNVIWAVNSSRIPWSPLCDVRMEAKEWVGEAMTEAEAMAFSGGRMRCVCSRGHIVRMQINLRSEERLEALMAMPILDFKEEIRRWLKEAKIVSDILDEDSKSVVVAWSFIGGVGRKQGSV